MKRRVKSEWWYGEADATPPVTIEVREDELAFTGILDANGNPIMREREPIGFASPRDGA